LTDPKAPPPPLATRTHAVVGRGDVTVRYAIASDAEQVAQLYIAGQKLAYGEFDEAKPYLACMSLAKEIADWKEQIARTDNLLYVGQFNGKAVGFANGGMAGSSRGIFTDNWVDPDWHRTGVAYVLAEQVLEHLRLAGATAAEAIVYLKNSYGDRFCKGMGFKYEGYIPRALWFHACDGLPELYGPFGSWKKQLAQEPGDLKLDG
jgi:GNAT superfamily N-acetyltransferase